MSDNLTCQQIIKEFETNGTYECNCYQIWKNHDDLKMPSVEYEKCFHIVSLLPELKKYNVNFEFECKNYHDYSELFKEHESYSHCKLYDKSKTTQQNITSLLKRKIF